MTIPRGIRNNNPGNIRLSQTKWQGEIVPGTDYTFCQFTSMTDGVRAIAMILLDYQAEHGLNSIASFIGRWAPSIENDTMAYVNDVSERSGIPATAKLDLFGNISDLCKIVSAICYHENGTSIDNETILAGCNLAHSEYR